MDANLVNCPQCGHAISTDAAVCTYCGKTFPKTSEAQEKETSPASAGLEMKTSAGDESVPSAVATTETVTPPPLPPLSYRSTADKDEETASVDEPSADFESAAYENTNRSEGIRALADDAVPTNAAADQTKAPKVNLMKSFEPELTEAEHTATQKTQDAASQMEATQKQPPVPDWPGTSDAAAEPSASSEVESEDTKEAAEAEDTGEKSVHEILAEPSEKVVEFQAKAKTAAVEEKSEAAVEIPVHVDDVASAFETVKAPDAALPKADAEADDSQALQLPKLSDKQMGAVALSEALNQIKDAKAKLKAKKEQKPAEEKEESAQGSKAAGTPAEGLEQKKAMQAKLEAIKKHKAALAKIEALKKQKAAKQKVEALKRKKAALAKAKALKKQKESQAKAEATVKETAAVPQKKAVKRHPPAATVASPRTKMMRLLKKYQGKNVGINYDNTADLKEATLVAANEEFFSIFVKDKGLKYNFPLKNILTLVEGKDGVETGTKEQKAKYPALIKVYPLVLF